MSNEPESEEGDVVDLARARVRLRSRSGNSPPESHTKEIADINLLLDRGHSVEAQTRLTKLISEARNQPLTLAQARLALSLALEMHGQPQDSLAAIVMYETTEGRAKLPADLALKLRVQISVGYNFCDDHPKAIALLQAALRELPEEDSAAAGSIYAALARVYRTISEYSIARDNSFRALECYRQSGDWRGLAEAYFGVAFADAHEGKHESALENYGQALKLIGDHPSTFFLGKIYGNMAGCWFFMKRPHDGVEYLQKAIGYYERTEHRKHAAVAYNNLGVNLLLIGKWDEAQEAIERALALANELGEQAKEIPMILDSLGELRMLRGDLDEASDYLRRAVAMAKEQVDKWYACQALRTFARCCIAMNASAEALAAARQALELAERIGDRQALHETQLILAESSLLTGKLDDCESHLQPVLEHTSDSEADLGLAGEAQRLQGLLAMARSDPSVAAQHFGRSASIFDLLGDRYRSARAHCELGRAYMQAQPDLAAEQLSRAANIFRELGAKRDLELAEAALNEHNQTEPQQDLRREAAVQLITLRLAEAVASRALLLRELAAVLRQETTAKRVMVLESDDEQKPRVVVTHGYSDNEATKSPTKRRFWITMQRVRNSPRVMISK